MTISNADFNHMQAYESYTKTKSQQRKMKYKLLDVVEAVYGESFDRLKQETRDAIDMLCFLATDKGFVYARDTYFEKQHNSSARTIRRVMKKLRETGIVVKKNRSSSKHNGLGTAVYFFVDHPCFTHWKKFFNLRVQADDQAENGESPCESKDTSSKKVSTYYLPKIHIKDHIMYATKWIKGVPKLINQTFAELFKESLRDLYLRTQIAYQKITQKTSLMLSKDRKQQIAYQSIKTLSTYLKTHSMTLEEQCKLVYTIAFNKFNAFSTNDLKEYKGKTIRKEMIPEWLAAQQEKSTEETEKELTPEEYATMEAILSHYR